MAQPDCPDHETLGLLLLGKLNGLRAEQLEKHLLHCDHCSQAAESIPDTDEVTAAFACDETRRVPMAGLAEAIERAKQIQAPTDTAGMDETSAFGDRSSAGDSAASADGELDAASDERMDFLAPAQQPDEIGRLGGYLVREVLGTGGMGVVFRAEDPSLKRQVALKVMKPSSASIKSAKDRFVREAQAVAAIEHDHIVPIYQVGEDRGVPFIAMQLLRGESLSQRLTRLRQLDEREVLRIGREVATGLAAAHQCGLIHRDIKPDNIWLEGESGRVKIVDFGLARAATDDSGLTHTGIVMGTPRYMAPEQAQGHSVDHRCDLFSLGSVLYHLVTGQAPFQGGNLTATLIAVAHEDPEPIDALWPETDPDLARLIMRQLSKDRDQRPQSATEVADSLADIERRGLDGPRAGPRVEGGRRPGTPILVGGALVAIVAMVCGGLWAAGLMPLPHAADRAAAPGRPAPRDDNPAAGAPGQGTTATNTAPTGADARIEVLKFELRHLMRVNDKDQAAGSIGHESFTTYIGDGVKISAELSAPAYCYLLACHPDGTMDVCFPENENEPPPLTAHPRYPSASAAYSYGLEEGTGLEAFFLVVSRQPLPSWQEMRNHLPASPWESTKTQPGVVWHYQQGQLLDRSSENPNGRGKGREIIGGGMVARMAEQWLLNAPQIEAVEGIGFAVLPAR